MATKTNAMRALDRAGIAYEVHVFGDPGGDKVSARVAAERLGVDPNAVLKTLVVLRDEANDRRPALALVASDRELDLGKTARALGVKRVRMAKQAEAERITGLRVGGISALALLGRRIDVLVDERAGALEKVLVSAGARSVDVELALSDFLALTGAALADVASA